MWNGYLKYSLLLGEKINKNSPTINRPTWITSVFPLRDMSNIRIRELYIFMGMV